MARKKKNLSPQLHFSLSIPIYNWLKMYLNFTGQDLTAHIRQLIVNDMKNTDREAYESIKKETK